MKLGLSKLVLFAACVSSLLLIGCGREQRGVNTQKVLVEFRAVLHEGAGDLQSYDGAVLLSESLQEINTFNIDRGLKKIIKKFIMLLMNIEKLQIFLS